MSLYQTLNKSLEPVLGERTSMILEEGVRRLGVTPEQLDASQAEVILKRLVYRELQAKMSPNAARARIEELLRELGAPTPPEKDKSEETKLNVHAKNILTDLEAGLKRFNLYLDWPEVGRLRGLINVIKQDPEASTVRSLIREGQEVLSQLEEKLQGALLRQTRDIAELHMAMQKVQNVGGPKIRRLENLIRQIEEAHSQETLAQAEVERARALAAELRKLVESSVVQNPTAEMPITLEDEVSETLENDTVELASEESDLVVDLDFEALSQEQQSRIREIDVTEDRRRLDGLIERYALALGDREIVAEQAMLLVELDAGRPLGERLSVFENRLKEAYHTLLTQAKAYHGQLTGRLKNIHLLSDKTAAVQLRLSVAQETLQAGGIPPELEEIDRNLTALEAEEQTTKAERERQLQLEHTSSILRTEAEASLAPFHGEDEVEMFLATLADLPPSEENIARARHSLSDLLARLSKEREEESIKRTGYKLTVQAVPRLEPLQGEQSALLTHIDNPALPLEELERSVALFMGQAKGFVQSRMDTLEAQVGQLEQAISENLPELRTQIQGIRNALDQGRITDPASLERQFSELVVTRRTAMGDELARYEVVARSMKGLGGEELEQRVISAKAELQSGKFPLMSEIHGLLSRLRRSQEALRAELSGRISALLEAYNGHKSVGGDTAYRLKPMCDFLQSAMDRLSRLGAGGLLEVRRALEEAERLEAQLEEEYQAARSVMSELKGADLESLLDVFDSPQPQPVQPVSTSAPTSAAVAQAVANSDLPQELQEVLTSFHLRGVEAVALIEKGKVLWGSLPIQSAIPQSVFDDLRNLANELSSSAPQLSVISLPHAVMVLLPLKEKGLIVLAEKALLSRILTQIEKHRDVLEAA